MSTPHVKSGGKQWFGESCFYCGRRASGFDHVVPTTKGGGGSRSNLVPACHPCNSRKGDKTVEQFRISEGLRGRRRMPIVFFGEDTGDVDRDFLLVSRGRSLNQLVQYNMSALE